ncbi:AlpA family phage regulatory protein [Colwellia sp. 6M3]|jgi:prophage regulatory protein|uniref:helix-turn-helix transcriptional regulator n=1 Tax=Colwellia sp. 6M3 TaxID=2759849 RepID=UPI0015F4365E|nr:AlpA family phage regulatory protein [Colwellia sp. 6M3]MBA6415823.1 AlpA family phage regulatory protein [Colwellia sp. 6M3]|tara:strand:- start:18096 stop:18326 length:231 start_codon:yes stop_codon:yes gene_type:complete
MLFTSNKSKEHNCNVVSERQPVDRIIRIDEMIRLLNVSRVTLYRWSRNGTFIKPIIYNNRTIGWAQRDYEDWLNRV